MKKFFGSKDPKLIGLRQGIKIQSFSILKLLQEKKKNQIEGILNHEDVWIEDRGEIKREFHVYFVNMFMTSCPTNMQIEIALAGLKPRVNAEMNEQLDMPFTEEVVLTALSQMCPTKAPGLDGLPATFFQKH